jgi:Ca2+-binding RTX toxin-like protein
MANTLSRFLRVERLEAREVPAFLQVIHNSPYTAAAVVDVYVNGELALNDFRFRTATGFLDVPAGVNLKIDVAPGTSTSSAQSLFTQTVNLADGKNYIAVAVGNPTSTGADAFGLSVTDTGRRTAADPTKVDVLAFHGAPDAPTVDVQARGAGTVVNDFSFRSFAGEGYLSLPPADYDLDVTTADGLVNVRGFDANLSGAAGKSVTVLASGFVVPPSGNTNDFQLLAAFADGTTALLPVLAPTVTGTAGRDVVFVTEASGVIAVTSNGSTQRFLAATNRTVSINTLGGDDYVNAFGLLGAAVNVDAGAGDDSIVGGERGDTLTGGSGNDLIFGFGGNDRIDGGAGNDILFGGFGNDRIRGGSGSDILIDFFGRNDLDGGSGFDIILR